MDLNDISSKIPNLKFLELKFPFLSIFYEKKWIQSLTVLSLFQYYEMSYGLNVEMHKQVSPKRSQIPQISHLCNEVRD